MVNWIWTGTLLAFANFFNKRSDSHAQQEIQDLAHAVAAIVEPLFPISWAALTKSEWLNHQITESGEVSYAHYPFQPTQYSLGKL